MNEHNPYAAPQTTEILQAIPHAQPREIGRPTDVEQSVARGAFYCHDALKTILSLFAGIFLYPFPSWFEFAAKYLMPCFVVIAHLLQLYGLRALGQAPRESGARWLIFISLIIFVGSAVSLVMSYLEWENLLGIIFMLAAILLYAVSFATLLWGILSFSSYLQLPSVRAWAKLSLACIGYLFLFEVVMQFTNIRSWFMRAPDSELFHIMVLIVHASWWLGLVLGVAFYALALRGLIRLGRMFSPDDSEGTPPGNQILAASSTIDGTP